MWILHDLSEFVAIIEGRENLGVETFEASIKLKLWLNEFEIKSKQNIENDIDEPICDCVDQID